MTTFITKNCKHVVLVGNGPLTEDRTELVDTADLVIRFNSCSNLNQGTSNRTDILVLNNVGQPAMNMLVQGPPVCAQDSLILFPRSVEIHFEYYDRCKIRNYPRSLVATNRAMIHHFTLRDYKALNPDSYRACFEILIGIDEKADFAMPSTGFVLLKYMAESKKIEKIDLLGFTFEGWEGHPWKKEKQVAQKYERDGKLRILS